MEPLELIDFEDADVQVLVCRGCGVTRCAPGGWVSLRRVTSEVVAWIPSFRRMEGSRDDVLQFSPPYGNGADSIPVFCSKVWSKLRKLSDEIPKLDELPALSARECARILQWEAPGAALGSAPSYPGLNHALILAVGQGAVSDWIERFSQVLAAWTTSEAPVSLVDVVGGAPNEAYLDLPGHPAWRPATFSGDRTVLHLGIEMGVEIK